MTAAGPSTGTNVIAGQDAAAERGTVSAMVQGALSFSLVAVLAYSIWPLGLIKHRPTMFAAIALVFIGLGGLALGRLMPMPGARKRFPLLFAAGFAIYALCYCAFWFGLRGRYFADYWGAALGLAGMTWFLQRTLGQKSGFLRAFVVLLIAHNIGYYAGGEFKAAVRGANGMLLWGVFHGLGFGAGLAYLLHHCRPSAKPA